MTISFRPARRDATGLFVALAGGTNSGKTFSALRLARGIAGPAGRIAAIDTEAGRMSHYAGEFVFDVSDLQPPFRPERFGEAAKAAEDAGYACLVIDSFSMEWVGPGGVLDWQAEEFQRMGGRDAMKLASWIRPKMAHKAMVYSFLQRRIPIVFALRAEQKAEKRGSEIASVWRPICNKTFPFEITVSFMLGQDKKGIVDLSDSSTWKMERGHRDIFKDGDQLSEDHGAKLAAWARGEGAATPPPRRTVAAFLDELAASLDAATTREAVDLVLERPDVAKALGALRGAALERLNGMVSAAIARVGEADDGFPGDGA